MPPQRSKTRFIIGFLLLSTLTLFLVGNVVSSAIKSHWLAAYGPQATSCLPWSWFVGHITRINNVHAGEIVMVHTPKAFNNAALGKLVIGLPGDRVVETKHGIWINGHFWGRLWIRRWLHTEKDQTPTLPYRFIVPKDHVLLLGTTPESWDGRYWGTVPFNHIYGELQPL